MFFKQELGEKGEKLARGYLRKRGYRILEERYRTRFGEVDLICREGKTVIFVEVRTRKSEDGIKAEESIRDKKIEHLVKSAQVWLGRKRLKGFKLRFDLISVNLAIRPPEIIHYPGWIQSHLDL